MGGGIKAQSSPFPTHTCIFTWKLDEVAEKSPQQQLQVTQQ
jgi:hypothetical protein